MRMTRITAVLLITPLLGCASISSMQRARTLRRGEREISADFGATVGRVLSRPRAGGVAFADEVEIYPTFPPSRGLPIGLAELGGAFGLNDWLEGRFRLSVMGVEAGLKMELLSADFELPVVLSVAPAARARPLSGGEAAFDLVLPLLIGVPFGEARAHEVVFSPRYMPTLGGPYGVVHGLGGGLGVFVKTVGGGTLMVEACGLLTATGLRASGSTAGAASLNLGYAWKL